MPQKNTESAPQQKNDPNQTTTDQCYHSHIQSDDTNSRRNARTSTRKTANQLGPIDPFFRAKVCTIYVNKYQSRGNGATNTTLASQQETDSKKEFKDGGSPPPQRST